MLTRCRSLRGSELHVSPVSRRRPDQRGPNTGLARYVLGARSMEIPSSQIPALHCPGSAAVRYSLCRQALVFAAAGVMACTSGGGDSADDHAPTASLDAGGTVPGDSGLDAGQGHTADVPSADAANAHAGHGGATDASTWDGTGGELADASATDAGGGAADASNSDAARDAAVDDAARDAAVDASTGTCTPACAANQVCCVDQHGHFPTCTNATTCP